MLKTLMFQLIFYCGIILVTAMGVAGDTGTGDTTDMNNNSKEDGETSEIGSENLRIVGGAIVQSPEELPYQVKLEIFITDGINAFDGGCGGTIISTKFILTAAHCFYAALVKGGPKVKALAQDMNVFVGVVDLTEKQAPVRVKKLIIHSKYDSNAKMVDYDIALLELCQPLKLNKSVNFIYISTPQDKVQKKAESSGFGQIRARDPLDPPTTDTINLLRKVELDLLEREECQETIKTYTGKYQEETRKTYGLITERNVCSIGQDRGNCQGDSGGPLTCRLSSLPTVKRVCGIVSFTSGCAFQGIPDVYVDLRNKEMNKWVYANAKLSEYTPYYCRKNPTVIETPNK